MRPPVKPQDEDCCNSLCNPCILDVYEQQLKLYQKYLEQGSSSNEPTENAISNLECANFQVVNTIDICDVHKIITFKRNLGDNKKVWWKAGHHFLIKYNTENLKCSRAYTPFKFKKHSSEDFDFQIVVKKYGGGIVSNYLFDLLEGDTTLWRGPYGSYESQINKYDRMIMFAQGTGIATFISIIEDIIYNEDDMTRIYLLACFKENAILFRDDLYSYKSYWNFNYKIFLNATSKIEAMYQEPIEYQKLDFKDIDTLQPFCSKDYFLLSGSSQFMQQYDEYLTKKGVFSKNIFKF